MKFPRPMLSHAIQALLLASLLSPLYGAEESAEEGSADVRAIGSRRELFVDHYLIDQLKGATLKMHEPQLMPPSPQPPDQGHYGTVLWDGETYHLYSRGDKIAGLHWKTDGWDTYHGNEVTLYAESKDGIHWTEPDLGLYKVERYPHGNVVLADVFSVSHNFTPFIDTRPGIPADQRYKALGGLKCHPQFQHVREKVGPMGLKAFVSPDGIHWKPLQAEPVIPEAWGNLDSQNVAFWSESEGCYVCYFRTTLNNLRTILRTTSPDFLNWTTPVPTNVNAPNEHLYTNGTQPYFRAPHIYIALPTRFHATRRSTTDIMLMSSRGGNTYDRTFMEAFIRPGLDKDAWGNRSNYAALNVVPTGPAELSIYLVGHRRYTLRMDGFASVNAPNSGGEMITKPFTFDGKELEINFSTSAGGAMQVEIQDAQGQAIPGFELDNCPEIVGDEIARVVAWKGGKDVSSLAGKPVRLRFVLQDADLYSLRFRP